MATKTAGTLLTTTLTAVLVAPNMSDADVAAINQLIWRDAGAVLGPIGSGGVNADGGGNKPGQILPGAITAKNGLLYLPGGRTDNPITLYPGDWIATDGFGNAFPIPGRAMPKTLVQNVTLTNGSNVVTSAVDIRTLGWQVGTHVTSAHTPANAVIGSIATNGLSFTLVTVTTNPYSLANANATGSQAENMTAGTFTHS